MQKGSFYHRISLSFTCFIIVFDDRGCKIIFFEIDWIQNINVFDEHKPNLKVQYVPIIAQRSFSMALLSNSMGEANITSYLGNPRLIIFNAYQKKKPKPFL